MKLCLNKRLTRMHSIGTSLLDLSKDIKAANTSGTMNRNISYEKTETLVPIGSICWYNNIHKGTCAQRSFNDVLCKTTNDVETGIEYLFQNKYRFFALFHINEEYEDTNVFTLQNNGDAYKEIDISTTKDYLSSPSFVFPQNEYYSMLNYASDRRKSKKLGISSNMLLSIAWVILKEKTFSLFPNAVFVDIIHSTNIEDCHLLI